MVHSPSTQKEYLEHIQAAPNDDEPRLAYAEWLSQTNDHRAELIRLQCPVGLSPAERALHEVETQERVEQLARFERDRLRLLFSLHISRPVFQHGFIVEAETSAEDFVKNAEILSREAPLLSHIHFGMAVRPATCAKLAQCPQLSHLKGISLSTCWKQFGGKDGDLCIDTLLASPHLQELEEFCIWRSEVSNAGLRTIARSPACRNLQTLRLPGNSIDDASLMELRGASFQHLHTLDLSRCNLSAVSVETLSATPFASTLRRLDLSGNNIGDDGLENLSRCDFPSLTHLRLQWGDCSPKFLGTLLRSPLGQKLEELDLSYFGGLGRRQGKELTKEIASSHLPSLKHLNLSSCLLTPADIQRLHLSGTVRQCIVDVSGNHIKDARHLPPNFIFLPNGPTEPVDEVFLKRPDVW